MQNIPNDRGYEKAAHLYDLFDTKENIEFFFRYASEAGAFPLSLVLSHKGRGKPNLPHSRGWGGWVFSLP